MPLLAVAALLLLLPLSPLAAQTPRVETPRAQVTLTFQLTRTEGGAATGKPQVVGAPVLITLDGSTGSLQITGGELEYALSVSPTLEPENRVALLWSLQLSGKSLPGATSATLSGATRVLRDRTEPVAELTLRDPRTGRSSSFHLVVKTTVTEPGKAAASMP